MDKETKPTYEPPYAEGKSKLVDAVIQEIRHCIAMGDVTSLDELLRYVPRVNLIGFLPEDQGKEWSA